MESAHLLSMLNLYTPWKDNKTLKFYNVFRGYRNGKLFRNGVKV